MKPRTKRLPAVACFLAALALVSPTTVTAAGLAPATKNQQIENLFAFAKLYGYIRYFHPSDEAARVDWDRFAIYGAGRVASVRTDAELKQVLEEMFLPIAPLLRLCPDSPPEPCVAPTFTQEQAAGKVLAWQHVGVQGNGPMYRSARTGRVAPAGSGPGFGGVGQMIPAAELRGKTIRIRAAVRANVQGSGNAAQVWGRVDRPSRQMGWFNNMADRPIVDRQWKEYEISGPVADDAEQLVFGCFLTGTGEARVDAWRVEVQKADGTWESVKISNPDFEGTADTVDGWFPIGDAASGYSFTPVADSGAFSGKRSVLIRSADPDAIQQLFSAKPALGEVIDKPLNEGLRVILPLTLPDPSPSSGSGERLNGLMAALARIDVRPLTAENLSVRLAGIVIAWNVFQHFFPYFDVVKADWPAEFRRAAAKALTDTGPEDFYVTLATMCTALQDGHGNVFSRELPRRRLAVRFEWVEGAAVVTASDDPEFKIGDVALEVNGQNTAEYVAGLEGLISGSEQWKRWKALTWEFGAGPPGSKTTLKLRRGGEEVLVTSSPTREWFEPQPSGPAIKRVSADIFYVDMRRAKMAEIRPRLEELAAARGVIFDVRGYPTDNYEILAHLTDTPLQSAIWQVPRTIYPDREKPAGFETSGRWAIEPQKPRLRKAVFLTSPAAISYAESVMGIIEHYRLGDIVGEATAGTNGNVNSFRLPGGFDVSWTGMRVIKHDGSQHHLVGIRPTLPVQRTIRAIQEGRDEVLAKALELLQAGPATD